MTIPASQIVQAIPSVLSAGGTPGSLQGLFLSSGTRVPLGLNGVPTVLSFPTATAVSTYFGPSSTEYAAAQIYFAGFTGSSILPPSLLFAQYPTVAVGAWLRGGSIASLLTLGLFTAAQSGTLIVSVAGTPYTTATITIPISSTPAAAVTLIQTAFTAVTAPVTVAYDSISGAFTITATTTGATSIITYATGTLSGTLNLTALLGAVVSQGSAVAVPSTFMTALLLVNNNWASFTHLFNPDASGNALRLAFATWNGLQGNDYIYVPWDSDVTAAAGASTTCLGALLAANSISGTMPVWGADYTKAAFICGVGAAINFTQNNGRITYAFKAQSGLVPDVTDPTTAANLIINGYNFYGSWALGANGWQNLYPGSISGQYKWADAYINQIWLNNSLQLSLMTLLENTLSIPYNAAGYGLIDAACQVSIQAAVTFGAIRAGVPPSALEAAQMNNAAGVAIAPTVGTRGWYLQIGTASTQTRGLRQSPPVTLWYADGGSVQQITIASIEVQ